MIKGAATVRELATWGCTIYCLGLPLHRARVVSCTPHADCNLKLPSKSWHHRSHCVCQRCTCGQFWCPIVFKADHGPAHRAGGKRSPANCARITNSWRETATVRALESTTLSRRDSSPTYHDGLTSPSCTNPLPACHHIRQTPVKDS